MSQYRPAGIAQEESVHSCREIWDKAETEEVQDTYGNWGAPI